MAIRLIKIAKELNVGLSTIVEFLHSKGFEIESKPTAPVTEEMHQELLKEFQNAMAVKEMADQLIIGKRAEKDEPAAQKPKLKPLEKLPELVIPEEPKIEEEPIPEAVVEAEVETETASEPEVEEEKETKVEETVLPKVKVVGKIDLKPKKPKKKKKKEPEEPVVEEKEVVKEIEEVVETAPEEKEEAEKTVEEEMVKHDAPQLKGLKILGKIDSSKLKKPRKKKKEEPKPKPKTDKDKPTKGASKDKKTAQEEADKPKRRRKRKKITQRDLEKDRRSRRSKRKDEHKEISAKEIEERMKATMARLGGGGKHKRQKMRRDKRESIREKQEQTQLEKSMDSKLQVTEFISVSDLANLMDISPTQIITTCMNLGVIVSINQRLDAELIELLADEFGHEIEFISAEEQVDTEDEITDAEEDLEPRAPIVTVMGHVDHGKTSLLDYIREENVASGEAGGITQHIGAYEVQVGKDKKKITFLDTPGHEAFTAMRARGAKVTDIAVIIVAADDRIMPQTKEAISHAQAAGVPLVFAINKIDKPGADPERIKQELANMNLLVEDWGGKYQSQDISAKTGTNIAELLEKILLEAELLDLKANPNRRAYGTVIEASLDKGRGYVTKILIENGTLKIGDYILAGEHSGRVKAMFNEWGKKIKGAGPATPVLILGLAGAPQAGENFKVMASEQEAKALANKRAQILREQNTRAAKRISLDEIGRRLALGTFKELNLIVKGDVDGSVEALSDALIKLSQETVQVKVIHKAVGQIAESDVLLASASDAIIIGFQVRPSMGARNLADKEGVQIKHYSIIYEAIEEVKMAIEGMLEPTKEEKITAHIEVREVYKISRIGTVAGCYVHEGKIHRNSHIRIVRDGIVIFPTKEGAVGEVLSLKRFKDDVKEVKNGMECGITVRNFNDIKVGDFIEAYEIIEIRQKLEF